MKITFLLAAVDDDHLAGTGRVAVAQANALAARHQVEVVSAVRTSDNDFVDVDPRVRVRYLTSATGGRGAIHTVDRAPQLASLPSTLVPEHWDSELSALCDITLERYLPDVDVDVLVTLTPGMLAAAAQRLPSGTALVYEDHQSSMDRSGGKEIVHAFGPRADAIVSLTEANAEWLREQLGSEAPPVHVVPYAAPDDHQPMSLLDQPLIVAAGRLKRDKQYAHLVRAFASVADQIPDWRLRIFGTGPKRASLMRTTRRYGLFDRVEFPGSSSDLASEWAKASISALTSSREGLPMAILESFAAGVPVVAYDCPTGPSALIDHGVNGYLVQQDDEKALATHLLELAHDRELRQLLGDNARKSLARFDRAAITQKWERIYADVVAGRGIGEIPWVVRKLADRSAETGARNAGNLPAITPAESRSDLTRLTASAISDISGWFVLPARGDFPPTFVIPHEYRREALGLLAKAGYPSHVSLSVGEQDHWLQRRGDVAEMVCALESAVVRGFALEPWPEIGGRASHLTNGSGVRVEFWSRSREGYLSSRLPNPYARRVDSADIGPHSLVEGAEVPTLVGIEGPFIEDPQFPIDIVYTWVDDSDPVWRADRDRRVEEVDIAQVRREAAGDARFRNRDELRYSLRSVHAHAPWVRNIYIVSAGQRPAWLVDHPSVRMVDHDEILPADALPTFNSHAIETALHKIPGLAEHFIYFNDDVFLGRPVGPGQFFTPSGQFATFIGDGTLGLPERDDRPFIKAGLNNRQLLQERFGVTTTHTVAHSPHPMRTSVLDQVCEEFADAVDRTARSAFRAPEDVSVTASLAQHYGVITGSAYPGELALDYVDTSKENVRSRLKGLLLRESDAFCLGDHHDYALAEHTVNDLLASFFEQYFPVRPSWEA